MKKIFLFLTISLFSIPAMYAVVTWDGTASEAWTKGTGTEADPYLIETPAHLAYLSAQVKAGNTYEGVRFLQTDDLNLNSKTWTSIGTSTYKFAGVYDGGEKYISNLTNSIFGYVNNSNIQNLTLQGADIIISDPKAYASLVNYAYGDCRISNCHNHIHFKTTSEIYRSSSFTIHCGGLIAKAECSSILIENCSNSGNIGYEYSFSGTYTKETCGYAGGIISEATNATIIRCFNTGSISAKLRGHYQNSDDQIQNVAAAGIIGRGTDNICNQCYNTGIISAYGSGDGSSNRNVYACGIGNCKLIQACYVVCTLSSSGTAASGSQFHAYSFGEGTIESCYALTNGGFPKAVSNVYHNSSTSTVGTYKSDIAFKSPSMIPLLNTIDEYFTMDLEGINDGYPILKWQAGPRYTITGSCDANRGTVKGGGEYAPGSTVTLTATPKKGCTFVGWSDGNTDNPRTVTVEGDATYRAQFIKSNYTIYVNQDCTSYIE